MASVSGRIQSRIREPASCSRLKDMVRRFVEQKIRDENFNARDEDRSLLGAAAWKGNPTGNPKGNGKENDQRSKEMEIAINGRKESCSRGRLVQLQANEEKKEDTDLSPKREDTRKEAEKEIIKGNGPKGTSPSGKSTNPLSTHFQKGQCQKDSAIRKSKESCIIIAANASITTTEEASVYVKGCGEQCKLMQKKSPSCTLARKNLPKHIHCKSENCAHDSRTWRSLSTQVPEAMPMQHREDRPPTAVTVTRTAQTHVLCTPCTGCFPLESSWCHGLRTSAEKANVRRCWRQSKTLKSAQREAKRKLVGANLNQSRSRRGCSEEPGSSQPMRALLHGHENVFFLRCCQRWWITEGY